MLRLCLLLLTLAPAATTATCTVKVPETDSAPSFTVIADVGSSTAFRLSVHFSKDQAGALQSPSLDETRSMAQYTRTSSPEGEGIKTSFGELIIRKDGRFILKDAAGVTISAATAPPQLGVEESGHQSITMAVTGSKTGPGATSRRPCLANGNWGAPFTWDPIDKFFAFAVSEWIADPELIHCYPVSFDGNSELIPHPDDSCTTISHLLPFNNISDELRFVNSSNCCESCNSEPECTAWMSDSDPAADGSNCHLYSCVDQWVPPDAVGLDDNKHFAGGVQSTCSDKKAPARYIHQKGWWILGSSADWYLAPTPSGGFDFTKVLFDLTGAPAVPPLYAMGFMGTYWGYKSMQQVEGYMHEFRDRKLPIDSFIMDYDWFGPDPCGAEATDQGGYNCGDYGYRNNWWNNVSFNQSDGTVVHCDTAADVFNHFHSEPLNMHFGAIRKPRTYSNKNFSSAQGWLLPLSSDVGEGGDINWNFSVPALREWYTDTHAHFIQDGMDFWWNDEGETAWFTYLEWNKAQAAQFHTHKPNTRHFTINRSWQPGMQRFPAISWTGDGQSCTHQELLRGVMLGCPLTSCDLTSPDATTLVRQYQSAVFTPIMRVHEMQGTPRFPWFWPNADDSSYADHQLAFQLALQMRYRFLPLMYSLAHTAYKTGRPISHPASFAFPRECSVPGSEQCRVAELTYMVGGTLLPSELGLAHTDQQPPPMENSSIAVLPSGSDWYRWNTTSIEKGGQTIKETIGLSEMVVFVLEGALLPLQANASIQYSAEAGGLLELQVYAGADGSFTMIEDDGISLDYQTSTEATRVTRWSWIDSNKTLTWATSGGGTLVSPNLYTHVLPVLFASGAKQPQYANVQPLVANNGRVVFK